jgi:hypothetical protein
MSNKKDIIKVLYYISTFDGGLYVTGKCNNARFILNMREANLDYVTMCANTLNAAGCGAKIYQRKDYNTDGYTRSPQVRLESRAHPTLTKIYERIYIDGKKVIDPHMLTMMDAEALAIIFMADGSRYLDRRCNASPSYFLNTKGFSYGDNLLLKQSIRDKLGLEFNLQRHNKYWYLRLRARDNNKFESLVLPFVQPSFLYKLGRLAPETGDDIVCSTQECVEAGGNDQPRR